MNFLKTLTEDMQAQVALQSIANAKAEQVWQADFAKFCDKKQALIADCVEAGLDIPYVEEALHYPNAMPKCIIIMTTVNALGYSLRINIAAGENSDCQGGSRYGYAVGCNVKLPGASKHCCLADPDAKSLYDALVETSKAALNEFIGAPAHRLIVEEPHATV